MRVLITGAAGLYGTNIIKRLVKNIDVDEIIAVDNSCFFKMDIFEIDLKLQKKIVFLKKDYRDLSIKEINSLDVDAVIHLAAFTSLIESMETPEEYFLNNEYGFFKFLQVLLRTKNQPLIIFASCYQVYGKPRYVPVDVEHPLDAQGVFGVTKLAGEKYCMAMNNWYNYPVVIIRNTNTYGPCQNLRGYIPVVANFINKALNNENLIVYNDGHHKRDFIYVEDAAKAYEMALFKGKKLTGKVFNIGTGSAITIKELAEKIIKITGAASEIISIPERQEAEIFVPDIKLISEKVGWQPQFSIDEGLKLTVNWFKNNLKEN